MTGRSRRAFAWIGLALLLAGVLGAAALVAQRRAIARALVDRQLRALGLAPVSHRVERLGLAEFGLRDLRIGEAGALEIDRIDARYSLASLWAGRLDAIDVSGVRLAGRVDASGAHFEALDPLLAADRGDAAATPGAPGLPALPARSVSARDVRVELATPRGAVQVRLDVRARQVDGAVELAGDFAGRGTWPGAEGSRRGPVPVAVELGVAGRVVPEGDTLRFDLDATSAGGRMAGTVAGALSLATGAGEAELSVAPFELRPGDLAGDLAQAVLGQPVAVTSGEVALRARANFGGDREPATRVELGVRNLTLTSELGGCERLDAAIELLGPTPLRTPPGQLVSAARMDFGIELTNGLVEFQLLPDGVIDVARARWSFAGGMIRTRGRADLGADTQQLVLDLDDIDLAALLALADVAGLSGTGRVNGRIPLVRRGSRIAIRGGRAAATDAGGWIRYTANAGLAAAAAGGDANLGLLTGALANFHYDELVASIDGDTAEPVTVAIRVSGANPDFMDGQPIVLNLTVESHLVDLLQKASAVYRLPEEIEKRIQEVRGGLR